MISGFFHPVPRLDFPIHPDAGWDKGPWDQVSALELKHYMGDLPGHFPHVAVKLAYDQDHLYVIFRVSDRFVCARKVNYQERVCEDSCVEFFFTPTEDHSRGYFNLEVNCGGTAYFHHQRGRGIADVPVSPRDFSAIQIAHTAPEIVDPEITQLTHWVVEYSLPFSVLVKYTPMIRPAPGVFWYANFYKCADKSSHPHWLTWSLVDLPAPDFHRPEFFGRLVFG